MGSIYHIKWIARTQNGDYNTTLCHLSKTHHLLKLSFKKFGKMTHLQISHYKRFPIHSICSIKFFFLLSFWPSLLSSIAVFISFTHSLDKNFTASHALFSNSRRNIYIKATFAATWMDRETVILSEVSQTEKDKYHMILLICGI